MYGLARVLTFSLPNAHASPLTKTSSSSSSSSLISPKVKRGLSVSYTAEVQGMATDPFASRHQNVAMAEAAAVSSSFHTTL